MKTIKKLIITSIMLAAFSVSAFAASGFEAILNVPIGLSLGLPAGKQYKNQEDVGVGPGFDIGVAAQLGYMFQVREGLGISLLGELGYAYDTWAISYKGKDYMGNNYTLYNSTSYNSLQIGILPKININQFSIGIGGGVKIPFSASMYSKYESGGTTEIYRENYNRNELVREGSEANNYGLGLSPAVIGYIKATFDYSIFFTDNMAMNVGLYLGYDFMPSPKAYEHTTYNESGTEVISRETYKDHEGTFDIGLQLGFRFGPRA